MRMERVATAGWSVHSGERAADYAPESSHLEQYASVFDSVEINSTFYRPHREATWLRWAASVPDEFRFAVKAPMTITHDAVLRNVHGLLKEFAEQIAPLGAKQGPVLFQLPPRLEFDGALATEFLTAVRETISGRIALEPRHASWFSPRVDDLLRWHSIARVAADPPKGSVIAGAPGGAVDWEYWRLHGSPRTYYSNYDVTFLAQLAGRVRGRDAWVVFDNTALSHAWMNARSLKTMLDDIPDVLGMAALGSLPAVA